MKKRYILLGSVVFYLFFLRTKKEEKKEVPVNSFDSIGTTIRDFVGDILKDSLRPEPVKEDKGKALEEKTKEKADKIKASVGISTTAGALSKITMGGIPVVFTPKTLVKFKSPITTDSIISKEDAIIHGLAEVRKAVEDKKEDEKRENEGTNKSQKPNDIIAPDKYHPIDERVDVMPTPPDIKISSLVFEPVKENEAISKDKWDFQYLISQARKNEWRLPEVFRGKSIPKYEELKNEVMQQLDIFTGDFTEDDKTNLSLFLERKFNETMEQIRFMKMDNQYNPENVSLLMSYANYINLLRGILFNYVPVNAVPVEVIGKVIKDNNEERYLDI